MLPDVDRVADIVVTTIKAALSPVKAELAALKAIQPLRGLDGAIGPPGEKGLDGAQGQKGDTGERGERGEKGDPGPAGRDADSAAVVELKAELAAVRAELARVKQLPDQGDVAAMLTKVVAAEVGRMPQPRDGKDADLTMIQAFVEASVVKAFAALPVPKDGRDGVSVDPAIVDVMVAAQVEKAVKAMPRPQDGRSVTVDDVRPLIDAELAKAVSAIPVPKDGRDGANGKDGAAGKDGKDGAPGTSIEPADVEAMVTAQITKAVATIPPAKDGEPGRSVDIAEVEALVSKAVASLPPPKDGRSVTVEELVPLIDASVKTAVAAIPVAKDGTGIVKVLIGRDGNLLLFLSDGSTTDVGRVVGKDVDMDTVQRLVVEEVTKIPRPKDGRDGIDGFGFEDLAADLDLETRTLTHRYVKGDRVKEFQWKLHGLVVFRGLWEAGRTYECGDQVVVKGSQYVALTTTARRPDQYGEGAKEWALTAQRGKDGKDGQPGKEGPPGRDRLPPRGPDTVVMPG